MKDLTHYFNSPLSSTKKSENESLVDEKTPKMNKKVRKKALKLDKLTPPEAEDNAVGVQQIEVLPNNDVGAEVVVQEQGLVNGDSSFIDVDCNKGSGKKKKKRKLSPSCEDTSKRTKRKVAKGRLKIIDISSNSPDSSNSPQPQSEKPSKSGLARDILVNSLVVEKLSSLLRDKEEDYEDDGYEIEDDSEKDEDYNCKKVKRKRKKRKSSRRKSVENGGNKEAVVTPLRNGNEATDKTEEEIIKLVELEPVSEKRNSLFMYYSKVDKTVKNLERTSEKIKVQALVHTPPSEKRRPSNGVITPSASVKASLKKKFSRLQKEFMKATDAIEVVSSEEIVQSQTSEVKQISNSCDSLLNNSDSCGLSQLGVRTISDWKIQLNSSLNKSESVNTDDDNEPANSNANNTLDTPGKNESNDKELPLKRKRKPNKKYIDTVDDCENSSEATTKRVKPVKRQSKLKISPPYSTVDLDDSSNDSVCEARTVRESTTNRNFNTSAKIGLNEKSSAGLMAKFLGKSLVSSPKESAPKIEKVDPSVLIARQKFLKSGLPDDFRQKIASQIEENIPDPPPFPSVSHVQQSDPMRLIWNIPEPRLKLGPSPAVDLEVTSDWQTLFPETEDLIADQSTDVVSLQKIRNKSFIKEFVRTKANTQPSINNRWTLMKTLKSAGVDSACWTDIYKPKTSHDILANKSSVERFKLWLETYKNTAVKQAGDEGSSDEFVHSSDESSTPPKERICIISGPIGCGKTSTVYAVAQELGYKVLEVNASHNRNGKKVTADLSEATQSHQVEHGSLKDIFNNDRKVKKKKKTKNKAANNDVSSKKRSLILVEEADILFEGFDDGFIPAIAALSLTSKRPMVFTVNNNNKRHFSKFVKPSDLMLEFHRPSSSNLASWLQLIALAEGVHLNDSHAERIAQWSNDDVRKSIVQLQFLAQSCESTAQWPSYIDRARWPSAVMDDDVTAEDDVITEDIATKDDVITKNNISTKDDVTTEDGATTENDVTTSTRSKSEIIASLRQVARRSDSLVVGDLLATWCNTGSCDPCPRPEHCVGQASTALNETAAPEKSGGRQTNYFAENILKHVGLCVASDVRSPRNRWKSDSNLKAAVPLLVRCSHSATYSDYLPTLRFFGKCEDLRLSAYTRRNRNFNYLQGLGVNTGDGLTFDAFS